MTRPALRGLIHHIDLSVRDLAAARVFYDRLLTFLGYAVSAQYPDGTDWDLAGDGPVTSIGIRCSSGENAAREHDRYAPGLHHLAWAAPDRADVDRLHALLVEGGATILDPPADYPQYAPVYYAVFFADPDGIKLEYCYRPD